MVKTKKKAEQVTPKTSHLTTRDGFSLLEVIVTVGIISAIVVVALPKLNRKSTELRSTVRKMGILSRELRTKAKLQNATYRLVISMSEEDRKPVHQFWVEKGSGQILNDYDPKNPPQLPDPNKEPDEKTPPPAFSPDPKIMKTPETLPDGLIFESIEIASADQPITSGIVYIHYLPTGFADEAAIHLASGEKIKWTLAIHPLTGRLEIIDEFVALEDLRAK